jgi:cellobiose phosphorylase
MLGIRPDFDALVIDPCIPPDWKGFTVKRVWRGATYEIEVDNSAGVSKGVKNGTVHDGAVSVGVHTDGDGPFVAIPAQKAGTLCKVLVVMGA